MKKIIQLRVNGEDYEVMADPHRTLLEVLREELHLTGSKRGCDRGDCGSCTVLLDGRPVLSCLTLAVEAQGVEVTTIEGVARGGELHPLQKAFVAKGAIQCGFCTPGFILAAKALLDGNPHPNEEQVREALSGNLCRCSGYNRIFQAIDAVARGEDA